MYMGFALGSVPTSAPVVSSSETVMDGTKMAAGTWLASSFTLPRVTVANQDYEITDWGPDVAVATLVIHDFAVASSVLGTTLNTPSASHSTASQVVSITRWDVNGNKISAGILTFTVRLGTGFSGSDPEFHRFDDNSNTPNNLLDEGGFWVACPGESNCWIVTTQKTSSLAGFSVSATTSPSPASSSPDNNAALYGLFALLAIPFLGGLAYIAHLMLNAPSAKTSLEDVMLSPDGLDSPSVTATSEYPLMVTPNTPTPYAMVVTSDPLATTSPFVFQLDPRTGTGVASW